MPGTVTVVGVEREVEGVPPQKIKHFSSPCTYLNIKTKFQLASFTRVYFSGRSAGRMVDGYSDNIANSVQQS